MNKGKPKSISEISGLRTNWMTDLALGQNPSWLQSIVEPDYLKTLGFSNTLLEMAQKSALVTPEYKMPWADIATEAAAQTRNSLLRSIEPMNSLYASLSEQFKMQTPMLDTLNLIKEQTFPYQIALTHFEEIQKKWNLAADNVLGGMTRTILDLFPPDYFIKIRLQRQYWLITEPEVLDKISELNPAYENIGQIVVEHYKENDWEKLSSKVESWRPSIPHRMHLFSAFLMITKEIKNDASCKANVPAIIAQIDGLIKELRALLPNEVKVRIQQEIHASLPEDLKESGKRVDTRNEVTVQVVAEVVDFWSADMLQEIIFGGLFRDSKNIKPVDSYLLFRHKIMHGDPDYLSYGIEENFVRLMLYVDFLVHLIGYFKSKQPFSGLSSLEE